MTATDEQPLSPSQVEELPYPRPIYETFTLEDNIPAIESRPNSSQSSKTLAADHGLLDILLAELL